MKKFMIKVSSMLPAFALALGVMVLNSACVSTYHQPKISDSLDEYRK